MFVTNNYDKSQRLPKGHKMAVTIALLVLIATIVSPRTASAGYGSHEAMNGPSFPVMRMSMPSMMTQPVMMQQCCPCGYANTGMMAMAISRPMSSSGKYGSRSSGSNGGGD